MNIRNIIKFFDSSIAAIIQTSWDAAKSAMAGYFGSVVMASDTSYSASTEIQYSPTEAAKMGAIGGAILGGTTYALVACLSDSRTVICQRSYNVIVSFAGGLLGYEILNICGNLTKIDITTTAISFGLGSAILMIPNACIGYLFLKTCLYLSENINELENREIEVSEITNTSEQQNLEIQIEEDFALEESDQKLIVNQVDSALENLNLDSPSVSYTPLRNSS